MAAPCDLGAQAIIAFDIGLGFVAQHQRLRGIKGRPANHLAIDQPVQQVQNMGFGGRPLRGPSLPRSTQPVHRDAGPARDIDHLAIATRFAQHVIL